MRLTADNKKCSSKLINSQNDFRVWGVVSALARDVRSINAKG